MWVSCFGLQQIHAPKDKGASVKGIDWIEITVKSLCFVPVCDIWHKYQWSSYLVFHFTVNFSFVSGSHMWKCYLKNVLIFTATSIFIDLAWIKNTLSPYAVQIYRAKILVKCHNFATEHL